MKTSLTLKDDTMGTRSFWPGIERRLSEIKIDANVISDYLSPCMLFELVSHIRGHYKISSHMEIVEGAGQGIFAALAYCRGFAERLFLPKIGFPGYFAFSKALGYRVTFYDPITLVCDQTYDSSASKSVVIISQPHNPTGRRYTPDAIQQLIRDCSGSGVVLIMDFGADFCGETIFKDFECNGFDVECMVQVASLGKLLGCPGLRLGIVWSSDKRVITEVHDFKIHMNRSPCPLAAVAAINLLADSKFIHELELARRELSTRRAWLYDLISLAGMKVTYPDSGCFVYLEDNGALNIDEVCGVRGTIFGGTVENVRLTTALQKSQWQRLCKSVIKSCASL